MTNESSNPGEEIARAALAKTVAARLRTIHGAMTSEPFSGSREILDLANELDPPVAARPDLATKPCARCGTPLPEHTIFHGPNPERATRQVASFGGRDWSGCYCPAPDWSHPAANYELGEHVLIGAPGDHQGSGVIVEFVNHTDVPIPGGFEDVYSVLVDGETEPRLFGTGWMRPNPTPAMARTLSIDLDPGNQPAIYMVPAGPDATALDDPGDETWDPTGAGDTHHGAEIDGYPLPAPDRSEDEE